MSLNNITFVTVTETEKAKKCKTNVSKTEN